MATFKYALQNDLSKDNVDVHKNLLSSLQGIGSLVLYNLNVDISSEQKRLNSDFLALKELLVSQNNLIVWHSFLKNDATPIRISKERLKSSIGKEISDLDTIESQVEREPIDLLILEDKNAKKVSDESLFFSTNKEITNPNLLRTSETFKNTNKL